MKRGAIITFFLLFTAVISYAQPSFHLGVKGGINSNQLSTNFEDYNAETIIKAHIGFFTRVGINRFYLQPEAYFIAKGSEITKKDNNASDIVSSFDYNAIDVPVLLGAHLFKGGMANVRVMAGPVFSFKVDSDIKDNDLDRIDKRFFEDRYFGYQYGLGVDISSFSLDIRLENAVDELYKTSNEELKNKTFLITLSYKIL